jgi:hypothetical protein
MDENSIKTNFTYKYGKTEITGDSRDPNLTKFVKREQLLRYARIFAFIILTAIAGLCTNRNQAQEKPANQNENPNNVSCNSP